MVNIFASDLDVDALLTPDTQKGHFWIIRLI
jgi:hypothetical protein